MANVDRPHGAIPIDPNAVTHGYKVASGNSIIYRKDFITMGADGIDVATAGARILGVADKYVGASTTDNADFPVYDDCKEFEIQADESTVEADIGQLANILATTGNTTTGQSKHELDSSSQSTAEAQLRILGKIKSPDNEWGTNVKLRVEIYMKERSTIEPATPGV